MSGMLVEDHDSDSISIDCRWLRWEGDKSWTPCVGVLVTPDWLVVKHSDSNMSLVPIHMIDKRLVLSNEEIPAHPERPLPAFAEVGSGPGLG